MEFIDLKEKTEELFKDVKPIELKDYALLKYPKYLPRMKRKVYQYSLEGFGNIRIRNTSRMSLRKLLTLSFTPNEGKNVPFLLVDTRKRGKKRLAYVEFYNTTDKEYPTLVPLKEKYKDLKDYKEKEAWYIKERREGSLIKCGKGKDEPALRNRILDALSSYKDVILHADKDEANLSRLSLFAQRRLKEGNPSSATLEKVLGKEKAEDFFNQIIRPLKPRY